MSLANLTRATTIPRDGMGRGDRWVSEDAVNSNGYIPLRNLRIDDIQIDCRRDHEGY